MITIMGCIHKNECNYLEGVKNYYPFAHFIHTIAICTLRRIYLQICKCQLLIRDIISTKQISFMKYILNFPFEKIELNNLK